MGALFDRFLEKATVRIGDATLQFGNANLGVIPDDMTFTAWCVKLGDEGLLVDGLPFSLDDRPAMRFIYDLLPSTPEEAWGKVLTLQKCAQVGFTVMEMLFCIFVALKWSPCKVGMYLPDQKLAAAKSSERFLPIVRTVPEAYSRLKAGKASEGNVMIRTMGNSRFHFLWTSGKAMTESFPIDVLTFDEVQEMTIADMEKTRERLSASKVRFTLMGSTANWPDADINWWFKRGKRYRMHTYCPSCGGYFMLDEHWPQCVAFDNERDDYRYCCPSCKGWIDDTQAGEWRAEFPNVKEDSVHFHQILSPTISAREMIESYYNAHDLKNWYNRKLGKPYTDPSQMPVSLDILNDCAAQGVAAGLVWKTKGRQTYMGVDNMGGFSCAFIVERMEDGRMAVDHVEAVYGLDPWSRLDELMEDFGVVICVCEQLPNYDSAKQFASRERYEKDGRWLGGHKGRVFLVASYTNIEDDMVRWGDATLSKADHKTSSEHRDRYTLSADQYKLMSWALARLVKRTTIFPDPAALVQTIESDSLRKTGVEAKVEDGKTYLVPILRDVVFHHMTHVALVTTKASEKDDEHKVKRKVVKVGIDPHFTFAYMLCCAAWCRAYGTTQFILPPGTKEIAVHSPESILPSAVVEAVREAMENTCGRCVSYQAEGSRCTERNCTVRPADPGCPWYVAPD